MDENWEMVALKSDDGNRLYRIRSQLPDGLDKAAYSENVVVEWRFADDGLPDKETSAILATFENHIDCLDDAGGNSLLVHVYTGAGIREWCYYTKDYDGFMEALNTALSGKPRFPIQILHAHDPVWKYRDGIKAFALDEER